MARLPRAPSMSLKSSERLAFTEPPRVRLGRNATASPPARWRAVRWSMVAGLGSNASPCATAVSPRYAVTTGVQSGVAGISARSGFSVGRKVPRVRLLGLR